MMVASGWNGVNATLDERKALGEHAGQPAAESVCELSTQPLYAPLAGLFELLPGGGCADIDALNALLGVQAVPPRSLHGQPIRFVHPDPGVRNYEQAIHATGRVPTRPGNWHDFFNALMWVRFPRTKAALNGLHVREMQRPHGGAGRGSVRDAATQFDESGLVVLSSDPTLFELLQQRRWHELFWVRRAQVTTGMRFLVFGHGLYDALRAPFYRMCGRAALVAASRAIIEAQPAEQCRHADAVLCERFSTDVGYPRPKSLLALPLLGIPGVCAHNERAEYYLDSLQFRPPPQWA